MNRLRDWQSRLRDVIASRTDASFTWWANDCCTFASACVEAVTGHNRLEGLGPWKDEREALRFIASFGGLRAAIGSVLGAEIPPTLAQAGDIGLYVERDREAVAVWAGSGWLAPASAGLARIDDSAVIAAWRCTGEPENA